MIRLLNIFAIFIFIISQGPAFAQDFESAVQFDVQYAVSERGGNAKEQVKAIEGTSIVTIEPAKISIRDGNKEKIYDFFDGTLNDVDHQAKSITRISLNAIPMFKEYEGKNRQVLSAAGKSAGIKNLEEDPFYIESVFGSIPGSDVAGKIKFKTDGGRTDVSYNGDAVASYAISGQGISPKLRDAYMKYILYSHDIHPEIRKSIGATGAYLAQLSYTNKSKLPVIEDRRYSMTGFRVPVAGRIEIPQAYQVNFAPDKRLDQIIKASQDRKMKSVEDYNIALSGFLSERKYMEALCVFNEYILETGGADIQKIQGSINQLFTDAPANSGVPQLAAAIVQAPESKEKITAAIKILEDARAKGVPNCHVLNVFLANHLAVMGQNHKARDLIIEALQQNPRMTGAYKDLGDKYLADYDMVNAWASWDQARKINPNHMLNAEIAKLEHTVRQRNPAYFNMRSE